jgi:hypothetical protein
MKTLFRPAWAAWVALAAAAAAAPAPKAPAPDQPDSSGLYNVSLASLGATGKGSGAPFNKDWPPSRALQPGLKGGGTLFGAPLKGGRVDVRMVVPVEIKALEVVALDYHGTQQPKAIDVFVDGKLAKHAELEDKPGQPQRIPLEAKGRVVGILVTEAYPPRPAPDGKKPLDYGGWARLRVLSTTNVAELMKPVEQHRVEASPSNIAPTVGSSAEGKVEVFGQPRVTRGHPCTLWDQEDIAHYKAMLGTSKDLQAQLAGLKKAMDARMAQPLGIPPPQKGPDGKWRHLSDKEAHEGKTYGAVHNQLGLDIANLGTVYALTGEPQYAEFCKKLLLAYADAHPNYGIGARAGFSHDPSKVFDQRLSDATWLIQVARGYDLIHDLPSITAEERKHIEEDLVRANARHIAGNHGTVEASTNWSAIDTCAILMAGYATDDPELINVALYGLKGTKEKPTGGLLDRHFGPSAIDEDGMWAEGAMGYQFMAMQALVADAEVLWHHGIDLYRFRDGALKRLFDSPLRIAYPDLTVPAIHDSHHGSIVGIEAYLYEYGYRRYRDPSYLLILNQAGTHLDAHFQQFPVSVLYDRDPAEKVAPVEWKSVNFFGVGYGILRTTTGAGTTSLLLDYGPDRSHGHPDKLSIDLYAFNDQLIIDPGSVWYEQPIYRRWYRTTLAHPTLVVDELDQAMAGATQLVYGPGEAMGIQRAFTRDAYPGVTMDRALFLTPEYVADLFGAFARLPRTMDLAWHLRGEFASDLKLEPMKFPEPVENGYNELGNPRRAATDQPWSATVARGESAARLVAAGGTPTEVIVGDGHYGLERPPTILERRSTNSALYGNAVDISGAKGGYVKAVAQEGGLDAGYGLLKVETPRGADLCFAAYRPGTHKAGGLETDAQQAFVLADGAEARAMYLGGGKALRAYGVALERGEPGLASLEKAETGAYVLANPSPSAATVTVACAALAGMEAFDLDARGQRVGPASVSRGGGGALGVRMKAGSRVEFAPKGAASAYDSRQAMLRKRQAEQEAAMAKAREDCLARTKVREAEAKARPAPANTVLVAAAEAFSAEGGGAARTSDTKRGAVGKALLGWDDVGHWLEWTFEVPAEGYYCLTVCYCSALDRIERELRVNGEVQEPYAPMVFPSTGGWANGSDDWRLLTAENPAVGQPLLLKLKQGANAVRLTNANGRGLNVNYVAITSPDVKATRELLAGKLPR